MYIYNGVLWKEKLILVTFSLSQKNYHIIEKDVF